MSHLIPGQVIPEQGEIELNLGKKVKTVKTLEQMSRLLLISNAISEKPDKESKVLKKPR